MSTPVCPYCLSLNFEPYKIKYWRCAQPPNGCGRVFVNPYILPDSLVADEQAATIEATISTDGQ